MSACPTSAASLLALLLALGAWRESGHEEDAPVDFARDVRPILAERCVQCHGPDEAVREAELRLDRPSGEDGGWLEDMGSGAAVVPGDLEESLLVKRVRSKGRRRMPPPRHGPPLEADEIATLERWIAAGAPSGRHWAYAPLRDVEVPGDGHPVDAFVDAQLRARGLERAPEADPLTLLRRVSLDLTGLPPTEDERRAFLDDREAGAYERAVDRLLASRAYAEHWTRRWLDLARYADSNGFTIDNARSIWPWRDWVLRSIDADEPYDQFTIRQLAGDLLPDATNADVVATGFHRNTQINGEGGAKDEENRISAVHDRVATTGAVWLGSTLECARCHDHKFDPVSTRDYYRLFAVFDSTEDGGVHTAPSVFVARDADEERAVAAYEARLDAAREGLRREAERAAAGWGIWQPARTKADNGPELAPRLDGSYRVLGQNAVTTTYTLQGAAPVGGVAALRVEALPLPGLPGGGPGRAGAGNFVLTGVRVAWRASGEGEWVDVALSDAAADFEQDTRADGGGAYPAVGVLDDDPRSGWAVKPAFGEPHVLHVGLAEAVPADAAELRVALEQEFGDHHAIGAFRLRTRSGDSSVYAPQVPEAWRAACDELAAATGARPDLPTSLVLRERPVPRTTHVLVRGSHLDRGEVVEPGVPAALDFEREPNGERLDRLGLARWLTHPDNALAHRVTVNRWWQAFFGVGLVETENDFGLRGAAPSHPDLLEWLAADFVASGFSRKALHRRIVTSATYRQSVPPHEELARDDPQNRLLARQRRLRLDAEAIRDAALVASGLLAPRFGGPPVQPPQPDGVFAFTQNVKRWEADEGPDRHRRTLYTRRWRSSLHPFLTTFDAPVPTVTCTRRERSTTPLQALTLANDPMLLELAEALGRRAHEEAGDAGVRHAFVLALGREPSEAEAELLERHLDDERDRLLARGVDASEAEARAWTAVGRVLLNLDEFVRRP